VSPEEREALDRMTVAAERWLEARAGGRDTAAADARVEAARVDFRRAERRRRRAERRAL
jgi:hypothetical protein